MCHETAFDNIQLQYCMGSGKYRTNVSLYLMLIIPSYLGQSRSQTKGDNCIAGDTPDIEYKEIPTLDPCARPIEEFFKSRVKTIIIGNLTAEITYARIEFALSSIILYTPCLNFSFGIMNTGPSSTSSHAEPLDVSSLSVAAWKIAPATRETGVLGIPARRSFTGTGTMAVSDEESRIKQSEFHFVHREKGYRPTKKG